MNKHINELVDNVLDDLLKTYEKDKEIFFKSYILLPLDIYKKIEKFATCKSVINVELCKKSKKVADLYHKHIK